MFHMRSPDQAGSNPFHDPSGACLSDVDLATRYRKCSYFGSQACKSGRPPGAWACIPGGSLLESIGAEAWLPKGDPCGLGPRPATGRSGEDLNQAGAQFVSRADHLQFPGLDELRDNRIEPLEPLDAPLDIGSG